MLQPLRLFIWGARVRVLHAGGQRSASSASHVVPLAVGAFCVWGRCGVQGGCACDPSDARGSNTGVGKTLVSAGVAAQHALSGGAVCYLKPLQTGFPADSDGDFVAQAAQRSASAGAAVHTLGAHAAHLAGPQPQSPRSSPAPGVVTARTLFAWRDAVGPHLAATRDARVVADSQVAPAVAAELRAFASATGVAGDTSTPLPLALVETAGGVCSPGPGGALQCDILRPLRLPALLVGDGRLGGISSTLCALDALALRGYDVEAVVIIDSDGGLHNADAVRKHLPRGTLLIELPPLPAALEAPEGSDSRVPTHVARWLDACTPQFRELALKLEEAHKRRLAAFAAAPSQARSKLWWPFTQHDDVRDADVTVVDGRCGDTLLVHDAAQASVAPLFDACSSWWTQGVSAAMQPRLTRAIGHATARWGHVMYPEAAHEPALELANRLLDGPGRGWAHRVFYSDDGSTAVEIGLKMALRAYAVKKGLLPHPPPLRVLALSGSYHGDTLGAANAQAPSVFTGPTQAPWYTPRGVFLDPPTVELAADGWRVVLPRGLVTDAVPAEALCFTKDGLFSTERDTSALCHAYRAIVAAALADAALHADGAVGAAIIEPVMHGASGMVFIDPAFQRSVAAVCRAQHVPLIADEVFSGLWRFGAISASQLLGVQPDVACYAKLLTGGTVPLAATLASEEVFDAFRGAEKTDALLHGHSYSAHAIGCAAACSALDIFSDGETNSNFVPGAGGGRLQELWDPVLVESVRSAPGVTRVVCIGTVFAAELAAASDGSGYRSNAARGVVKRLRRHGIFARPLGNVLYLMVTPMTQQDACSRLLQALLVELPLHGAREEERRAVVC